MRSTARTLLLAPFVAAVLVGCSSTNTGSTESSGSSSSPSDACQDAAVSEALDTLAGKADSGRTRVVGLYGSESSEVDAYAEIINDSTVTAAYSSGGIDSALEPAQDLAAKLCANAPQRAKFTMPKTECGRVVLDAMTEAWESDQAAQTAYERLTRDYGADSPEVSAFTSLNQRASIRDEKIRNGTVGARAFVSPTIVDGACGDTGPTTSTSSSSETPSSSASTAVDPDQPRATAVPTSMDDFPFDYLNGANCATHVDYWSQVATSENIDEILRVDYSGQIWHGYHAWLTDAAAESDLANDPAGVAERVCPAGS